MTYQEQIPKAESGRVRGLIHGDATSEKKINGNQA